MGVSLVVRCPRCGNASPWEPPDWTNLNRPPTGGESLRVCPMLWCILCSHGRWELRWTPAGHVRVWVWTSLFKFVVAA